MSVRWGRRALGFSLVETAMSIGIMGMMLGSFALQQSEQTRRERAWAAADRLREVQGWTARFLDANGQSLLRTLTPGVVASMAVRQGGPGDGGGLPSLEEGGFVPEGFRDRTSFGHSHAVLLRSSPNGAVLALVVQVGGRPLDDGDVGRMVRRIGAAGGGRFSNPLDPKDRDAIVGADGGWRLDAAEWSANGVSVSAGRVVARADLVTGARMRGPQAAPQQPRQQPQAPQPEPQILQ